MKGQFDEQSEHSNKFIYIFFDRDIHLIDMLLLGIRKQNLACFQYFLL